MTRLLTAQEVAERLRVPTSWVYASARRRVLPAVKLGHYWRFREDAIEAFVARLEGKPVGVEAHRARRPHSDSAQRA